MIGILELGILTRSYELIDTPTYDLTKIYYKYQKMYTHNENKLSYTPIKSKSFNFFYNVNYLKEKNPSKTIKHCFSVFYNNGNFLNAVYSNLVNYDGFFEEGCYWYYPDMNSPYPEDRFYGVKFASGFDDPDWTVYVTESECFEYTKQACFRFLEIHPDKVYENFLNEILENWKPLNIRG